MSMEQSGLFNTHFAGRDGYIWWIGQIAPESTWKENIPGKAEDSNDDIKGFGERYRVRIMGYHTKADIEDDELPWAYVIYPVTAGGGGRGSYQSANLVEGNFVQGFFMDGENAQMPMITGVIGYNDYQETMRSLREGQPSTRFLPASGYLLDEKIPYYGVRDSSGGQFLTQDDATGVNVQEYIIASAQGDLSIKERNSEEMKKDGEKDEVLAETSECEPMPLAKVQKTMQNLVQDIEDLRKSAVNPLEALSNEVSNIQGEIENLCAKAAKVIASALKWIITQIEKFVLEKINSQIKEVTYLTQPNEERQELRQETETINDKIACLFKKIIDELLGMVEDMLRDALCGDQMVNVPECAAENLMGNMIGQLLAMINQTVNAMLGAIGGLTGGAGIPGLGGAGGAMGFIEELISFLDCEEEGECPEVNEWSMWSGSGKTGGSITSLIEKAKGFASQGGGGGGGFSGPQLDLSGFDFSGINNTTAATSGGCNVGPRPCGPPTARWYGGHGSGAKGNLIISALGSIIGYDAIETGSGYGPKTKGKVYDDCGKGNGAVIRPITDNNGGIIDIIVEQPGTGYLPSPDGSSGGDGREWKKPDDTIVIRDGTYPVPRPPGDVVEVIPGDEVTTPPGTRVVTECGDDIRGGVPFTITCESTFTAPKPDYDRNQLDYPSTNEGAYPVIMYLCEIIIKDNGFNYIDTDQVIIEPSNGAKAEAKFDKFGTVISVKVTEQGEGFKEMPKIYIQSDVGFNAELLPKLCIDRISNDDAKEPTFQDQVVTVIDCVGKF